MTEPNLVTDNTRVAIECLTLWMESDRQAAAQHIAGLLHDPDGPGATRITAGLLNLSMLLVLELAKARGAEDIAAGAREYLQGLSPELPE